MEKLGRKRSETRQRILNVSKAYFSDYGFRDTLISDIAKHCHLDRRTIYRYFPSKESILIHITANMFDKFTTEAQNYKFDPEDNPYQKIEKLFAKYYRYIVENPRMIQFMGMIDVYVGTEMYDKDEFQTLDQHGKRLDAILERLIEEGQVKNLINGDYQPGEYAVAINNSLIALATRIAIYRPEAIIQHRGTAWNLLKIQGKMLLESLKVK